MSDVVYIRAADLARIRAQGTGNKRVVADSQVLDLSQVARSKPATVERVDGPPMGEKGSSWDRDRLFGDYYGDGVLYEGEPTEDCDLEDMLRRDGRARSVEGVLTLPIRAATWKMTPHKNDQGEAAFTEDALMRPTADGGMEVPWQTIVGQLTAGCLYRRACFEKVWRDDDDGKLRYQKLAYRMPSTCYLARRAEDAAFAGFMQWTWKGQEFVRVLIPAEKSWVYIHGAHRNPLVGISDLDVCWTAYQTKQKIRWLWAQFLELQVTPRLLAKAANGSSEDLAKKVVATKGGGVIAAGNKDDEVEVIESSGDGAEEYKAAIAYLDSEMAESVLAGFLSLTGAAANQGRGSNALSEDASAFFLDSRKAVLAEIAMSATTDVVAPLVRYNFGRDAAVPTLTPSDIGASDEAQTAVTLFQALASSPNPSLLAPQEFLDMLTERVAGYLGLDTGKVHEALTASDRPTVADQLARQGQMTEELAKAHNATGRAEKMVRNGGPAPAATH